MNSTKSKSAAERTKTMYAMIEAYLQEPGASQREFCTRRQITLSTFYYYLAKYRQEQQNLSKTKPTGRFIPVTLPAQSASSGGASACEIIWPDGVVVRFCTLPSPAYLLALIESGSHLQ